eukprot:363045-Chlamydomonas_euryale.AAC.4
MDVRKDNINGRSQEGPLTHAPYCPCSNQREICRCDPGSAMSSGVRTGIRHHVTKSKKTQATRHPG